MNPHAILASLGLSGSATAVPVSGGWDTLIWKVEHAGATYALRLFSERQHETCRREVLAMEAAAAVGISVPHVHTQGVWQNRPVLLLSWCAGRPLVAELLEHPQRAHAWGASFGRAQAAIHAVSPPAELSDDPDGWLRWCGPDEELLQSRLRTVVHGSAPVLIHLDFHPLNVMADAQDVTCVLDWANARSGPPRADLARTATILRLAPLPEGIPTAQVRAIRRAFYAGWSSAYEAVMGCPGDMALFYAWAGAVMLHDLTPKLGQPGVTLTESDLAAIRRWTRYWKNYADQRPTTNDQRRPTTDDQRCSERTATVRDVVD